MYATILSIPRMQINHVLAFVCVLSRCSGNSTTFAIYKVRALLMSPMKEEMTKFAQMKPLSPQGHRSVDYKTSKCDDRSWTSSSQQRWSVLGFTQYGSSCLEKDDDYLKNMSASLILCTASQSCAAAKRVHVDSK